MSYLSWEGLVSNARILSNALTRDLDKLVVPRGKIVILTQSVTATCLDSG